MSNPKIHKLWGDWRPFLLRISVILGDALAVLIAYSFAYVLRFRAQPILQMFPATKGVPPFADYGQLFPVIIFMWVLAMSWQGGYSRIKLAASDEIIRVFKAAVLGSLLSMSAMFLYRDISYSRLVFVMGGGVCAAFLYIHRQMIKALYVIWIRRRRRATRVLIVGDGYLSMSIKRILDRNGDSAVLRKNHTDPAHIRRTVLRSRIEEVLLAHQQMSHKDAIALANFCEDRNISFRIIPDILEIRMGEVVIDESLGLPTFRLKPVSLHGTSFLTKRVMDVVIASLAIGFLSLPLILIAILIKITSSGPVLYHHERMGYRQRPFPFMKFRTMVQNADYLLDELKKMSDRGGPVFKMKNDPRITPFGRFLRRYSLDELPQLLNVLRGEMSVVGPRPQVLWEAAAYDEWARKRLNVLPGISGLWQVSGRAELTYEEMIELDIFYIEHWSPGLDIKIIMKTIPAVLMAKGAY